MDSYHNSMVGGHQGVEHREDASADFASFVSSCTTYHGGTLELNMELAMRCCDECASSPDKSHVLLDAAAEKMRRGTDPEGIHLSLELVEVCVKNNGLDFARTMDDSFLRAMVKILKLTTFKRSLSRDVKDQLSKWIGSSPHSGVATDPRIHKLRRKVLFLLQLWHDSFILYQDKVPSIFAAYKKLRADGIEFPTLDRSFRYFVKNAEGSPVFVTDSTRNDTTGCDRNWREQITEIHRVLRLLEAGCCDRTTEMKYIGVLRQHQITVQRRISKLLDQNASALDTNQLKLLLEVSDLIEPRVALNSQSTRSGLNVNEVRPILGDRSLQLGNANEYIGKATDACENTEVDVVDGVEEIPHIAPPPPPPVDAPRDLNAVRRKCPSCAWDRFKGTEADPRSSSIGRTSSSTFRPRTDANNIHLGSVGEHISIPSASVDNGKKHLREIRTVSADDSYASDADKPQCKTPHSGGSKPRLCEMGKLRTSEGLLTGERCDPFAADGSNQIKNTNYKSEFSWGDFVSGDHIRSTVAGANRDATPRPLAFADDPFAEDFAAESSDVCAGRPINLNTTKTALWGENSSSAAKENSGSWPRCLDPDTTEHVEPDDQACCPFAENISFDDVHTREHMNAERSVLRNSARSHDGELTSAGTIHSGGDGK